MSPHAAAIDAAAIEWARAHALIDGDAGAEKLARARIGWLVARAFFDGERGALQLAAEWTVWFCLLDDRIEREAPLPAAVWLAALLDAFRGGPADDGDPFARALVELRDRLARAADAEWLVEFAARLRDVFTGFACEALHRESGRRPEPGAYRAMREQTVGLYPQFALTRLTSGVALPPEVLAHETVRRLMAAASACVGWANDIFTYEKELREGEVNNLVLALMDAESLPLEQAVQRACETHDREVRAFLDAERALPSFGGAAVDGELKRYVELMRAFIRGHLDWSRETARYA